MVLQTALRSCQVAFWAAFFVMACTVSSIADEEKWHYGESLFGEPKYDQSFEHYEHVNPDAPKGGTLNSVAYGGFDSFNPFIPRGRAAVGLNYFGGFLYDTLFEQSVDQPSTSYGLVAEAFRKADDYSWAIYRLNPNAKWHDGKQISVDDVIWSMQTLREVDPRWSQYFKNVVKVEAIADREIKFSFDISGNRELPHIIGDLVVLPKHWWEGTDAEGKKRDITQPTAEAPLGSGPYKIESFELGKNITWKRVENHWAENHPLHKGRFNFDKRKYVYFLDQTAMWEAFKKGKLEDIRRENTSKRWATEYTFPAVENGDVVKQTFEIDRSPFFQAYWLNTRRKKFSDPQVREALGLVFDFETLNKNAFFEAYTRNTSFFQGSELAATDIPRGQELEILREFKDQLQKDVFTKPYIPPILGSNRAMRKSQRKALRLLSLAGYSYKDGKIVDSDGEQLTIEFLGRSPTDERVTLPFIENLRKIGIEGSLRIVDTAQYQARTDEFDFDIIFQVINGQSLSPGNEQREYWSSQSADKKGSRNLAGIKNPVVDELVERIIVAPNREELVQLTKALDRVLLWNHYIIPSWHSPELRYAFWRKIKLPSTQPSKIGFDVESAWIDVEIENELEN